ncbi:peroxiredoxin [Acrasis kona]|uniref:Peroxiredoxin n=1 Tax=Acrasis kona TaxID=1008807 RepID=A0AAW2ZKF7_9EUKA
MTFKEGERVPDVTFKTRVRDESVEGPNKFAWKDLTSKEIFDGKKVIIVALPGAFTPTCSTSHLPGYEAHYDEIKKSGIDEIYCLSVNDAFVMFQWAKAQGVTKVKMLPDGNGDFSKALGTLVHKTNLGFGPRSWRYSMLVEDGVIKKIFTEENQRDNAEDDAFKVSNVETFVEYFKNN